MDDSLASSTRALSSFLASVAFHIYFRFIQQSRMSYSNNTDVELLKLQIERLTSALKKESDLRKEERASRISLQRRAREEKINKNVEKGFTYNPIGVVRSPFSNRCGTPRQPILVPAAKGRICFNKRLIQHEHFKELEEFSHIWVWL